jgi:pyruvate/2-oxoglutarate dehydrogenase complex dihydrolipoamide dehydrogenase (E3) component
MVAAEFAAGTLGLHVAVVERGRVGGDCLWTGCVPSKALLASAKAAHVMRHADRYGLRPVEPQIDSATVWKRIRVTAKKTKVVGAHILAPAAGEMIHELALAIDQQLKLRDVASLIHVYPTLSTAVGQLAAEAAFQGASRYRWLVRRERGRS